MAQSKPQRLELPKLLSPVTANSVKAWLDGCEDAHEVYQLTYPDQEVKPQLRILMAGLKMDAPEASQWWSENREALKALTKWEDFVVKVKERFIPSGWKLEALATFYAVRQKNLPFSEFVAALQSARGILGTAGTNYKISDSTFKHHLLLFCHPLLSLRVRALPGLGYDTIKVDSLINLMSSTWNSMVAEGVTRQESASSGIGRPSCARFGSLPPLTESEKSSLKASGGCFHCRRTPASPGWTAHTSKTCPGDPSRNIAPRSTNVAAVETLTVAAVDAWVDDVEFVRPEVPGFGILDYVSTDEEDASPYASAAVAPIGEDSDDDSD